MEFTEIMTPALNDCPKFTVDNTQLYVPVIGNALEVRFKSGNDQYMFTNADNFTILSAGYYIPSSFVPWNYENTQPQQQACPELMLKLQEPAGPIYWSIKGFGSNGISKLPMPNYEFAIGNFIKPLDLGLSQGTYQVYGRFGVGNGVPDRMQISMINVPASLNGLTVYLIPFIKIVHTIQLL